MRRVIKIGGSLLLRQSLPRAVESWVRSQPPAETITIVGGGELIDAVRRLDSVHSFPSAWVHWQCVALLRTTYQWLGLQLSAWKQVSTAEEFACLKQSSVSTAAEASMAGSYLVAVDSFYRPDTPAPLPEDWTTTTDAIAGWLSVLLDADELVLLKSCDVDPSLSLGELARQGVIDEALPILANRLPTLRLVNFAAELDQ